MKLKANGTFQARMTVSRHEKQDSMHYNSSLVAVPVTNDMAIIIYPVLILMANWGAEIVDVKGAFFQSEFKLE